jgi:hypothetical protein
MRVVEWNECRGSVCAHSCCASVRVFLFPPLSLSPWHRKPRQRWLFDYPAQIALTASQIIWTEEVNSQFEAFGDGNEQAMKEYSKTLAARLEALISLVLGELNARDRIKIITLITVDVHNRDVVQKLIDTKTQEFSAFAWQSQMRMKWKPETKQCHIKVADATFNYSYEYIGNVRKELGDTKGSGMRSALPVEKRFSALGARGRTDLRLALFEFFSFFIFFFFSRPVAS